MESFNLNIIPGKDRPVCHASQFDIGRQFHVNLFEGFNVFTLDGTETISLSVRKPDGNVVTASVTNTSDSYVEFVTTEQMTACEGSNLCELKFEKGSDVIGTANFILEVEVDPLEGGVQSASEIDNLQTQVAGMVAAEVADQYDSANVIFDAVPTAGHGVGYAVTSEGVKNELDPIKADVSGLQSDVGDLQTDVGNLQDDISDAYDDTATYSEGEIVIYDGVIYECTVTGGITTPESWDPTHWTATTIKALLALKQNATDNSLNTTDKTVVGAINEVRNYNNLINKPTIPTNTSDLINDSGFTIGKTVSWGTSITIDYIKSNFLLFASNQLFVLWFYGGGYVNVDIRNIGTNDVASGSGTATLGSITVTRTSGGFTVTLAGNATITVIG